jgi:uncharacterized protein YkwD
MMKVLFQKTITTFYAAIIAVGLLAVNSTTVAAAENRTDDSSVSSNMASPGRSTADRLEQNHSITDTAVAISPEEEAMVRLLNQDRANAGLPELEIDLTLVKLAQEKSRDMVTHNYFGHISKRLGTVYEQLIEAGVQCTAVAENLVGAPNIGKAQLFIMRSPVQRDHVLDPKFTKIGIGVIRGGSHGKMITQIFLQ